MGRLIYFFDKSYFTLSWAMVAVSCLKASRDHLPISHSLKEAHTEVAYGMLASVLGGLNLYSKQTVAVVDMESLHDLYQIIKPFVDDIQVAVEEVSLLSLWRDFCWQVLDVLLVHPVKRCMFFNSRQLLTEWCHILLTNIG